MAEAFLVLLAPLPPLARKLRSSPYWVKACLRGEQPA
jgi:hypothetical protein